MILLKLGGSVITDKGTPLSPRRQAVRAIGEALGGVSEPVIVVHGGGSYGHYWSVVHDIHTRPDRYDLGGVSTVKNSMVELNSMVLNMLREGGVKPYAVPPEALFGGGTISEAAAGRACEIAESGMVPVTYGDALWSGGGTAYILSGDAIMRELARTAGPRLCIFATDVDGLYERMGDGEPIGVVGDGGFSISEVGMDVTGGMRRKVQEARRISEAGCDVLLLNGNRPGRIAEAIGRGTFPGTLFRGRRDG